MLFSSKRKQARLTLLLGWLLLGGNLWAQSPMSLKECIDYALKNHGLLAVSDNEIASAKQKVREGLSAYLPQVNGQVQFDDNIQRPTTVIPAGAFGPQEIRIQFGNQYNTNAVVQLDQVLYDRSLLLGLKALDPFGDIAVLTKEKNEQTLMYGAAMSYYAVQILKVQQKLLADNLEKFEKMEKVVALQVAQGVARKIDFDRVSVGLANIRMQQEVMANELAMAYNRLKNAMGMPLDQPIEVQASDLTALSTMQSPATPTGGPGKVLDLKIQTAALQAQEIDLRRRNAMYLPTLSMYARAGAQAFGNELGKSLENWYGYASIGLNLRVPIWNSFRTAASIKQAELALLSAKENFSMSKNNILMQIENASAQLNTAQASIDVATKNMDLAKENLAVTQLQYEKGVATLSDYLSADYGYKEAQSNYISSLLRIVTARLELEKAQGTLDAFLQQQ